MKLYLARDCFDDFRRATRIGEQLLRLFGETRLKTKLASWRIKFERVPAFRLWNR